MNSECTLETTKHISSSPFEIGACERSWFDYHGNEVNVWSFFGFQLENPWEIHVQLGSWWLMVEHRSRRYHEIYKVQKYQSRHIEIQTDFFSGINRFNASFAKKLSKWSTGARSHILAHFSLFASLHSCLSSLTGSAWPQSSHSGSCWLSEVRAYQVTAQPSRLLLFHVRISFILSSSSPCLLFHGCG